MRSRHHHQNYSNFFCWENTVRSWKPFRACLVLFSMIPCVLIRVLYQTPKTVKFDLLNKLSWSFCVDIKCPTICSTGVLNEIIQIIYIFDNDPTVIATKITPKITPKITGKNSLTPYIKSFFFHNIKRIRTFLVNKNCNREILQELV